MDRRRRRTAGGAEWRRLYPNCRATADFDEALADPAFDLVAIATPPRAPLHHDACRRLPPASTCSSRSRWPKKRRGLEELLDAARSRGVRLFTDHTFLYAGAVEAMRQKRSSTAISAKSTTPSQSRVNLGLFNKPT